MLSILFHHLVPASLYGGKTIWPTLLEIDREFRGCSGGEGLVATAEKSKLALYAQLRPRFARAPAQALSLKLINICLAMDHLRARQGSLQSRPIGLVVDPSNMCLLACPGCVHSTRSQSLKVFEWCNGTLSLARFSALLRIYGPYLIGVYFCNFGEPLLNLGTPELIRAAKGYLTWTALSTSLSVPRLDADAYVESGLDFMFLSIDGATQTVYERFRRDGNLELVFDNIRSLVASRRRLRKKTPLLSWKFLAFEHNVHEIPMAARMARILGVDQFHVVSPYDVTWDDPDIRPAASVKTRLRRLNWLSMANRPENWNPFPEAINEETIAHAFETPLCTSEPVEEKPSSGSGHTCHWLYKSLVMDATGRIMPCCSAPRPDADLVFAQFEGSGNPFNSQKHRNARAFFSTGTVPLDDAPYCVKCNWDQTGVDIGGPEIRRYFRTVDPAYFDRRSLRLLSEW